VLFPYLENKAETYDRVNPMIGRPDGWGTSLDSIPRGVSCLPFIWDYLGKEYPMDFLAGFVGIEHGPAGVRPSMGWAVRDTQA
jgi:hypothetical protein